MERVAGGVRISYLTAGVSYSQFSSDLAWRGAGGIPHPFQRGRVVAVPAEALVSDAAQRVFRLDLGLNVPQGSQVELSAFGGPAFHRLRYETVRALGFRYVYPFDEATAPALHSEALESSGTGYHAGFDLSVYPVSNVGVGVLLGYRPSPLSLRIRDEAVGLDTSPLAFELGIRARF